MLEMLESQQDILKIRASFSVRLAYPTWLFMMEGNSSKATVMKFDGTNWLIVGNAGFSPDMVAYISLAFSPAGEPYVAYEDHANSEKASVIKFDGTNWINAGIAGFTAGAAYYIS